MNEMDRKLVLLSTKDDRITSEVRDRDYFMTVYKDGSGGYFSLDGNANTARSPRDLEPDDTIKRFEIMNKMCNVMEGL